MLYTTEDYTHRYPVCWRCGTDLVFRVVSEWFISADEIRPRMKAAADHGALDADRGGQADAGLAEQHGRLVHQPQALLGPAPADVDLPRL